MTEFTPGPWIFVGGAVYKDGPDVWPKGDNDGIRIALMDRDTPDTIPPERDANARLIATAPDLLAALEKLIAWHDWDYQKEDGEEVITVDKFLERGRAAIIKARDQ